MNHRTHLVRLVVAVLLTALAATGATALAGNGQLLTYAHHIPIQSMDIGNPQAYPSSNEANKLVYENLVAFSPELEYVPQLATSYEVSDDGLRWTFHLRAGVQFHDGTVFDSSVVKFNVERNQAGSRYGPIWVGISVETPDPQTAVLVLQAPKNDMLNLIAHESGGMASPTAVEAYGEEFRVHPTGTGPYAVTRFEPGVEVLFERFDAYWGEPSGYEQVRFVYVPEVDTRIALLQSGQADVINDVPPEQAEMLGLNPDINVLRTPGLRPFFLVLNTLRPQLQDVRVRQALNHAVDKNGIIRGLFFGYAHEMHSPASHVIDGYANVGTYEYDPDRASQLLADAGYTLQDGVMTNGDVRLELTLNVSEGEYLKDLQVAEVIQQQLRAIGVDVTIQKVERAARWSYLRVPPTETQWDAALFGFNPSDASIYYHLAANWRSNVDPEAAPAIWNTSRYANPAVDQLIEGARTELDDAVRLQKLEDAQRIIFEDAPAVWLYTLDLVGAARSDVDGVFIWPTLFVSVRDAR